MEASSVRSRSRTKNSRTSASIQSFDADLLCNIFASLDPLDLACCSAVCKSWHSAILTSNLLKDLYYKKHPHSHVSVHPEASLKIWLEDLAMEQHRLSVLSGHVEVHQWNGHTIGVNQCRMKMGSILTGVGDKVLRMWSSESYKCLGEFFVPDKAALVDFDFDESKIVGLVGPHICIWKNGKRSLFPSKEGTFRRGLCMRYMDPGVVIGCEDGTARVFDMYSQRCSQIVRMHHGPITCLAFTDEQLIVSGSSLGSITVSDLSSDQTVACLKPSSVPTGMRCLCFNPRSHSVFAGSTAGFSHCWDLRMMRPLWETRVSPNVVYSMEHMQNDKSTLVVGGIDGILRILDQNTGALLLNYVTDKGTTAMVSSSGGLGVFEKKKGKSPSEDVCIDSIPRHTRPAITCVAVGMKKVVTTHNAKYIKMWRFKN